MSATCIKSESTVRPAFCDISFNSFLNIFVL